MFYVQVARVFIFPGLLFILLQYLHSAYSYLEKFDFLEKVLSLPTAVFLSVVECSILSKKLKGLSYNIDYLLSRPRSRRHVCGEQ